MQKGQVEQQECTSKAGQDIDAIVKCMVKFMQSMYSAMSKLHEKLCKGGFGADINSLQLCHAESKTEIANPIDPNLGNVKLDHPIEVSVCMDKEVCTAADASKGAQIPKEFGFEWSCKDAAPASPCEEAMTKTMATVMANDDFKKATEDNEKKMKETQQKMEECLKEAKDEDEKTKCGMDMIRAHLDSFNPIMETMCKGEYGVDANDLQLCEWGSKNEFVMDGMTIKTDDPLEAKMCVDKTECTKEDIEKKGPLPPDATASFECTDAALLAGTQRETHLSVVTAALVGVLSCLLA